VNDAIDHSLGEQELGPLESFRQLLIDRLLDHARSGEPDQRPRLRQDHVADGGEAGRHAPRRRVGHDRDVGDARVVEPRQERVRLGHLHQGEDALEHARAARGGDQDQGVAFLEREQDATGDPLTGGRCHAPSEEGEIHDPDHQGPALDRALAHEDGFAQPGFLARPLQAVRVALRVAPLEGIGRDHLGEPLHEGALIEQDFQIRPGGDTEMVGAFRAGPEIPLELLVIQDLAAFLAFRPESVRQLPFPLRRLEPSF